MSLPEAEATLERLIKAKWLKTPTRAGEIRLAPRLFAEMEDYLREVYGFGDGDSSE